MKLKKIDISGFKSFAKRTIMEMDGSIVGIVGPNGSGKSNINDAIRWVFSGTSTQHLRAKSTQDIIFAGTKTSKPAQVCSVKVFFENLDRKISIDSDLISVSRTVKRGISGSVYTINEQVVSQQQIKILGSEIGITKSSLAVISQGSILSLAESNPQQRKMFFEETAGVLKYKIHKTETGKKLERSEAELKKAQSNLLDLQKNLNSLKKQAKNAQLFQKYSKEIEELELSINHKKLLEMQESLQNYQQQLEEFVTQKDLKEKEIEETKNLVTSLKESLEVLEKKEEETKTSFKEKEKQLLEIQNIKTKAHFHNQMLQQKLSSSGIDNIESLNTFLKEKQDELEKEKLSVESFETQINEKTSLRKTLLEEIENKKNLFNKLQGELETLKRQDLLFESSDNKNRLFSGVRTIIENIEEFPGIFGILGDIIEYEMHLKEAVEVVLGSKLQNIVTQDTDSIEDAIQYLKETKRGKATFIALDRIEARLMNSYDKNQLLKHYPVIGVGEDLITCERKFEEIKNFYLGNVVFCENIQNALIVSKDFNFKYVIVTLEGDIIRKSGEISGGSSLNQKTQSSSKNVFNVKQLIRQKSKELSSLQEEVISLNQKFEGLEQQISELYQKKQAAQEKFLETKHEIQKLQEELSFWTNNEEAQTTLEDLDALEEKFQLQEQEVLKIQSLLDEINKESEQKRKEVFDHLQDIQKCENLLRELLNQETKILLQQQNQESQISQLCADFWKKYNVDLNTASVSHSEDENMNLEEKMERVEELNEKIGNLKNTTFDAQEELETLSLKFEEKQKVKSELEEAYNKIKDQFVELDNKIAEKIGLTVERVNSHFEETFSKMFGEGAHAQLTFTHPDNIIESGIEIIAKLPGKNVKSLKLFSGGEKSLIIISLLFAILMTHQLPFCILDEAEAALDESNLNRFVNFLKQLKDKTQFIVITHRNSTIINMEQLFGLTMQEKGATSMFSIELENARELIDGS